MLRLIENEEKVQTEVSSVLDKIVREGALKMLKAALQYEVEEYLAKFEGEKDTENRRLVTRHRKAQKRTILTGAGALEIEMPRVRDRRKNENFISKILPPYMRKSPNVAKVIPVLYLRALSTGDFSEGLAALFGTGASGLSATTISRLTNVWKGEYAAFKNQRFEDKEFAYIWADGIHFRVRLDNERLCTLVLMGVREDGSKELIAVEDGFRESTESWSEVLRALKRRGLKPPALAIADGALGFWKAVGDVWPQTKQQRCWVHKLGNVLDKLPKRSQPRAKQMLHEIMAAESKKNAQESIKDFKEMYEDKYPKQ